MAVVQQNQEEGAYFIDRVGTYPVIASTVDQVKNIYSKCKESNALVKYSLETAESGAKFVTSSATPVIEKLPIATVNKLAVDQLDKLEQKYPIVTKPTDEVLEETKKFYESNLKSKVDRVQAVGQYATDKYEGAKEYGYSTYEGAKDYGYSTYEGAKEYGYNKVQELKHVGTEQLNKFLETPQGQAVVNSIDHAICYAETYADKYLSETSESEKEKNPDATPRTRLYNRTMKELKHLQLRSQETLQNLHFTVDLIEYARSNIDKAKTTVTDTVQAAKEKGQYYLEEIQKLEEENGTEIESETKSLERRAIGMARHLTRHLKDGLATMSEVANQGSIKETIQETVTFTNALLWTFMKATNVEELPEFTVNLAKEQLVKIQESLLKVNQLISSYWGMDPGSMQQEEVEMEEVNGQNGENGDHQ